MPFSNYKCTDVIREGDPLFEAAPVGRNRGGSFASICDGDQQIVANARSEQGNRYIRSFSVVIDADDFTDVIGRRWWASGIGAGAVFPCRCTAGRWHSIRVANFGQVAVVKFFLHCPSYPSR